MQLEDYTAEGICRAMGLTGFIEPGWTEPEHTALRVVLTPSFHSEVCISLARGPGESVKLIVAALSEKLWQNPNPYVPAYKNEVEVEISAWEKMITLFREAHETVERSGRFICLDGMGCEACVVSAKETARFKTHVSVHGATGRLVGSLIELGWHGCRDGFVRNALAAAGGYVGLKLAVMEVPKEKVVTRLAVLGTDEERKEYFEMMQRVRKEKS